VHRGTDPSIFFISIPSPEPTSLIARDHQLAKGAPPRPAPVLQGNLEPGVALQMGFGCSAWVPWVMYLSPQQTQLRFAYIFIALASFVTSVHLAQEHGFIQMRYECCSQHQAPTHAPSLHLNRSELALLFLVNISPHWSLVS